MRNSLTTIISFISLLILTGIQFYVVKSYYEEKSQNFDMLYSRAIQSPFQSKDQLFSFDPLDSALNEFAKSLLMQNADSLELRKENIKIEFLKLIKQYDANPVTVKKYIAENNLDSHFVSTYIIRKISLLELTDEQLTIYKQTTELSSKPKGLYIKSFYREGNFYAVQYDYYVDFTQKQKIILAEMRGILWLVIFTIAAVLIALTLTINRLNRQKKLSALKDDFIDSITHEFKTPLSVISLGVSSLKQKDIRENENKFMETCKIMEKQNHYLSKMIDNVIDVSLLDRKASSGRIKNVQFKQFIREIVHTFKLQDINGKKVEIIEHCSIPDDFEYFLDPIQFARVLNNLLENSVKYCSTNPVIEVFIEADKNLMITIKDNGTGIKKEEQEHVFNKFYRDSAPSNSKGLGLGLYIVKRIIDNHQGTIELESTYGKGTTISIILPLKTN